jgi:cell division septum initiation protein DivIVA
MDELLDDLKKQSSQENAENKALFASISTLESEMQKYDQWITTTKEEM